MNFLLEVWVNGLSYPIRNASSKCSVRAVCGYVKLNPFAFASREEIENQRGDHFGHPSQFAIIFFAERTRTASKALVEGAHV